MMAHSILVEILGAAASLVQVMITSRSIIEPLQRKYFIKLLLVNCSSMIIVCSLWTSLEALTPMDTSQIYLIRKIWLKQ